MVGVMTIEGRPAPNLTVSLQSAERTTWDAGSLAFVTDSKGAFLGTRRAQTGKLAVIVQNDVLRVFDGRQWLSVWRGIYAPAPAEMNFRCTRSAAAWKCTMNGLRSLDEERQKPRQ